MAKIVELIETDELVGAGTEDNPSRRLQQLWSKDGRLIADFDPCADTGRYQPEGITGTRDLVIGRGSFVGSYSEKKAGAR